MQRFDLFTRVHKGLRALLTSLADDALATGGRGPGFAARVVRAVTFLREHGEHEDAHVLPLVRRCAPELADLLTRDHLVLEQLHARLLAAAAAGEVGDGDVLALVEAHFNHMRREEQDASRALWQAFDDDTLAAASTAIQRDIPLPRMIEWLGLFLPAWTPDERAAWKAAGAAGAPPPVAAALVDAARRILGPDRPEIS